MNETLLSYPTFTSTEFLKTADFYRQSKMPWFAFSWLLISSNTFSMFINPKIIQFNLVCWKFEWVEVLTVCSLALACGEDWRGSVRVMMTGSHQHLENQRADDANPYKKRSAPIAYMCSYFKYFPWSCFHHIDCLHISVYRPVSFLWFIGVTLWLLSGLCATFTFFGECV